MDDNLDDYDLYNLSMGVTPEEVERATRNEVLIIRGRRRKVRVPIEKKISLGQGKNRDTSWSHLEHSNEWYTGTGNQEDDKINHNPSEFNEPSSYVGVQRSTESSQQSFNQNEVGALGSENIEEPEDWRIKYRPCSTIWNPGSYFIPNLCDDKTEKFESFNDSEVPHFQSELPGYQTAVWSFDAFGDVPEAPLLYANEPEAATKAVEISTSIHNDKVDVIKQMDPYQKKDSGESEFKPEVQHSNDTMDHQRSAQDAGGSYYHYGGQNRGGSYPSGDKGQGGEGRGQGGSMNQGGGRNNLPGVGGGGGGGRDNNGRGGGRKHWSNNWNDTTVEEDDDDTTSTYSSKSTGSALSKKRKKLANLLKESTSGTTILWKMPSGPEISRASETSTGLGLNATARDLSDDDDGSYDFDYDSNPNLRRSRKGNKSAASALTVTFSDGLENRNSSSTLGSINSGGKSLTSVNSPRSVSGQSLALDNPSEDSSKSEPPDPEPVKHVRRSGSKSSLEILNQSKPIRKLRKLKKRHRTRHEEASKMKLIHGATRKYLHDVKDSGAWKSVHSAHSSWTIRSTSRVSKKSSRKSKNGKRKRKYRKSKRDEYFSDAEISSDEQMDSNEDSGSGEQERDVEWLDESDEGKVDIYYKFGVKFPVEGNPEEVADNFMDKLKPLFTVMQLTGRMPLKIVREEKCLKFEFERSSKEFIAFCVTSCFFIFCCIASILSLVVIANPKFPRSFYEDVVISEFDKYREEGILGVLTLYYICTWSLWTIFEGGLHLAEYLTRWNLAIMTLRYDVTRRIRWTINFFFVFYTLYASVCISLFFFGGDAIPTARGASGFIGLLIFGPFVKELRVRPDFLLVQYFGLVFHLYSVWCGGLILLVVMAYCLALQNAAKRLNLRVAFALGKVAVLIENEMRRHHFRVIPYWKLWGEHKILTSLSRHTGTVFSVALNAFYLTKMAAMVGTLYGVIHPILNTFPQFNHTFFNLSQAYNGTRNVSSYKDVVPIRFIEPGGTVMGKALYYALESWLLFIIFTQAVNGAGSTLMEGYGYVRRHGTVICKTAMERRFIASIQNSFPPNRAYYINVGYLINREFITGFISFVMVLFVLLAQSSPSQLKKESTIVCDEAGKCRQIIYFKRSWIVPKGLYPQPQLSSSTPNPFVIESTTTGNPGQRNIPKPGRTSFPPCLPEGLLPIKVSDFASPCYGKSSVTYLPMLFTKDGKYFDQLRHGCKTHILDPKGQTVNYDCFGVEVTKLDRDECKMTMVPTPDPSGDKTDPEVELVAFPKNGPKEKLFCCFKFRQLEDQARRCNLWNDRDYDKICEAGTLGKRKDYEDELLQEIKNRGIINPEGDSSMNWSKWKDCICQGVGGLPVDDKFCLFSDTVPPCDPNFIPNFGPDCSRTQWEELPLGVKMQLIFTRNKRNRYEIIKGSSGLSCQDYKYDRTNSSYFDLTSYKRTHNVTTCFGDNYQDDVVKKFDDCRNLYVNFNEVGYSGLPRVKLVKKSGTEVVCCYSWKDDGTSLTCNLPVGGTSRSEFSPDRRCSPRFQRHSNATKYVEKYLEMSSVLNEQLFVDCICQQYVTGNFDQWDESICSGVITTTTPTTTTTTTTRRTTTTTTTTVPTTTRTTTPRTTTTQRSPRTTTRNPNRKYRCSKNTTRQEFMNIMTTNCTRVPDNNQLIFGYTDAKGRELYFFQDCSSSGYDKLESFRKPVTYPSVWDCYGNEFKWDEWRDDCGNFPLHTPNNRNEPTSPKLVEVRLSTADYRCCWEYEGFPFGSTDRGCNLRSTNSGSPRTMNKLCAKRVGRETCGTVFRGSANKNNLYNADCLESKIMDGGDLICKAGK